MWLKRISNIFSLPDRQAVHRLLIALVIGMIGGAVFAWLNLPLPWMLGAMAATMAASLAGVDIAVPQAVRRPMISLVGVILGSTFTSDRVGKMIEWLPSVATMPVYVLVLGIAMLFYLRKVSGFDHKTGFFAAAPGGLSEMVILADQWGADLRNVALLHSARLLLIVFSIPLLASYAVDIESTMPIDARHNEIRPFELVSIVTIAAVGWGLAGPLRLPAPIFMGPLIASVIVHVTGLINLDPPVFLLAIAQLVIGSSVGARFSGVPFGLILRTLFIGSGGALILFVLTFLFAVVLHHITGYPLTLILLALIPGGFPEMSLIALSMGMDPAFVVTHHATRTLIIFACALPIFTLLSRDGWFKRFWYS
ncbi:MAG: AbrB family transcriptional regulator [Geminicoccaceae bacterium]